MARARTEIECLERYSDLMGGLGELLAFLVSEKLSSMEELNKIKGNSTSTCKAMCLLLKELQSKDKLQLLDYEWHLLPVERIKITLVTDRAKKEFVYNY